MELDTIGAVGGLTFAAIVWGVVSVFRPLLTKWLEPDVIIPPVVLTLGVALAFVAVAAGELESANPFATFLLGVVIGLSAMGLRQVNQSRQNISGQSPDTR